MNTHQTRPLLDDMQELYAIALREHGPQGRSTRWIAETIEAVRRDRVVAPPGRGGKTQSRVHREGPDSSR